MLIVEKSPVRVMGNVKAASKEQDERRSLERGKECRLGSQWSSTVAKTSKRLHVCTHTLCFVHNEDA